jgi:O-methyltransferase
MLYDKSSPPALDIWKCNVPPNESVCEVDSDDYVRYRTLELIREQIGNLPGNVAECGVFLGEFSRMINHCFPDRKLFLYDTFEGFDERDFAFELEKEFSPEDYLRNGCKPLVSDPIQFIREK